MDIKIGKSAKHCCACEADFLHEQVIYSLLRPLDDLYVREDFCESCWSEERAEAAFSSWTAQYYDPDALNDDSEEEFSPLRKTFYAVVEDQDRLSQSIAYLAAQLLRRQKVFRLIKETEDLETEESLILFNDRIGNRLIEVHDARLTHAEMEAGRLELLSKLSALENPESIEDSEESISAIEEPLAAAADAAEER